MNVPNLTIRYNWQEKYQEAVLETDRSQLLARIVAAQGAVNARLREIQTDHRNTTEETQALIDAMHGLQTLRNEIP